MRTPTTIFPALLAAGLLALAGCAVRSSESTSPAAPTATPSPAPPVTEIFFYPAKGQTREQQERDRYECYLWAREQTGFDPSLPQLAPDQRIDVQPAPTDNKPAAGAMAGAIIGAITSPRGEKAEGAVKGAMTGAILGGMAQEAEMREAEQRAQYERNQVNAKLAQQAADYRRAMTACLEGRGYTVK